MRTTTTLISLIAVTGLLAIGCATTQSPELKEAEQSYSQAKGNPALTQNASVTLYEAKQALDQAQNADNLKAQKHYAFIAQKKVELAQAQADRMKVQERIADLQKQQVKFLTQRRLQETQRAKQEAERARQKARQEQRQRQQARTELQQLRAQLAAMKAKQTKSGIVLTLGDVMFDFDKAQLKSGAVHNLSRLADFLKDHPQRRVLVEGFTDSIGSEQYNQKLSQRRAGSVKRALQSDGVATGRITTRGLGENYPVATNDTNAGRQQNRRVEITILNPNEKPEAAGRAASRS